MEEKEEDVELTPDEMKIMYDNYRFRFLDLLTQIDHTNKRLRGLVNEDPDKYAALTDILQESKSQMLAMQLRFSGELEKVKISLNNRGVKTK